MTGQVSISISNSGNDAKIEFKGFFLGTNRLAIHEMVPNQEFKDALIDNIFDLGFDYQLSEIAQYFLGTLQFTSGTVYLENDDADLFNYLEQTMSVSISSAQSDPTAVSPFNITVEFGEEVQTGSFTASDLTLVNAAAGTPSTADDTEFTVAITPTGAGLVSITLPASKVFSAADSKPNVDATFSITYTP